MVEARIKCVFVADSRSSVLLFDILHMYIVIEMNIFEVLEIR